MKLPEGTAYTVSCSISIFNCWAMLLIMVNCTHESPQRHLGAWQVVFLQRTGGVYLSFDPKTAWWFQLLMNWVKGETSSFSMDFPMKFSGVLYIFLETNLTKVRFTVNSSGDVWSVTVTCPGTTTWNRSHIICSAFMRDAVRWASRYRRAALVFWAALALLQAKLAKVFAL